MKAFTKRIIWFFGFWLFDLIGEWLFYITHYVAWNQYYPEDVVGIASLISIGMHYIPLIFMKDDEIKRGKKK